MSGDLGIKSTLPACLEFLKCHNDVRLILVGDCKNNDFSLFPDQSVISLIHTTEVVNMNDTPQFALRNKKHSSMRLAIEQVQLNKADAVISAGNTGVLMATARYILRMIPGIQKPAIAKLLPTLKEHVCMLDLGANVSSTEENLLQFAVMGSQLMTNLYNIKSPKVGLLNIGHESIKGTETMRRSTQMLELSQLNFIGNVEGSDISIGDVDVVVSDGLLGNIALKTMEGTVRFIKQSFKHEFERNLLSKLVALLATPVLRRVRQQLNSDKLNGAVLLGLNGIVVKSHGSANKDAFFYALQHTYNEVICNSVDKLKKHLCDNQELLENIII